MSLPLIEHLEVRKGSTFTRKVLWETDTFLYRPITGISKSAPAIVTCPAHALPNGWRATVVSVKGMTELNCDNSPPKDSDWHTIKVVDATTIELNDVNSSDYVAYLSGGYLKCYAPKDLAGYTARMQVKTAVGGELLLTLTTENGGIDINNTDKQISINISAALTEGMTWKRGVYDLELISGSTVTSILAGTMRVIAEITT